MPDARHESTVRRTALQSGVFYHGFLIGAVLAPAALMALIESSVVGTAPLLVSTAAFFVLVVLAGLLLPALQAGTRFWMRDYLAYVLDRRPTPSYDPARARVSTYAFWLPKGPDGPADCLDAAFGLDSRPRPWDGDGDAGSSYRRLARTWFVAPMAWVAVLFVFVAALTVLSGSHRPLSEVLGMAAGLGILAGAAPTWLQLRRWRGWARWYRDEVTASTRRPPDGPTADDATPLPERL